MSVAEPAEYGTEIGSIQLNTPRGLAMIAVVAPDGWFDPMVPLLGGESTFRTVDGTRARVTAGLPTEYEVADAGWECGAWDWRLYTGWGSVEEVWQFVELLVPGLDCEP